MQEAAPVQRAANDVSRVVDVVRLTGTATKRRQSADARLAAGLREPHDGGPTSTPWETESDDLSRGIDILRDAAESIWKRPQILDDPAAPRLGPEHGVVRSSEEVRERVSRDLSDLVHSPGDGR